MSEKPSVKFASTMRSWIECDQHYFSSRWTLQNKYEFLLQFKSKSSFKWELMLSCSYKFWLVHPRNFLVQKWNKPLEFLLFFYIRNSICHVLVNSINDDLTKKSCYMWNRNPFFYSSWPYHTQIKIYLN